MGVLQSLTGSETAQLSFGGVDRRQPVEPGAGYFVGRLQKDWNKGNTILGGMITSTDRAIDDPALAFLPRHALTGGLDLVRFIANRSYVVEGKAAFSRVSGDPAALVALQEDPVHYFQRPDATHLAVDRNATSMTGHAGTVRVARYGNSKWRASNITRWVSPGLELNDVGYLRQADFIRNETLVGYKETDPRGIFRTYGVSVERGDDWDFGGLRTEGSWSAEAEALFANKWELVLDTHYIGTDVDTRLLRGGPAFRREPFWSTSVGVTTDPSRRAVLSFTTHQHTGPEGALRASQFTSGVRVRALNPLRLAVDVSHESVTDDVQYVDTAASEAGPRYLLGRLDQSTLSTTLRVDLQLGPNLTVQYYGSPFVSSGRFDTFKRVTESRAAEYADRFHVLGAGELRYDATTNRYLVTEPDAVYGFTNPDFTFHELRSNLVTRWEFRPGSTLFLVWTQGRTGSVPYADSLQHGFDNLRDAPATNIFLMKVSYWLPF